MRIYYKYEKAEILRNMIIEKLRSYCDAGKNLVISISTYQNGRETGFEIQVSDIIKDEYYSKKVTFSENRNTDQIVVYLNNDGCQGLDDKAYSTAKYFRYDNYGEATEYCYNHLYPVKN